MILKTQLMNFSMRKSFPLSVFRANNPRFPSHTYFSTEIKDSDKGTNENDEKPKKKKYHSRGEKAVKPLVIEQRDRNSDLEAHAKALGLEWRVMAATVLHRYPIVTSDLEPWEVDFYNVLDKIDDAKRKAFVEKVKNTKGDIITDENPTYEEILKTMPFTPASRITEADLTNNRKSIERKLDRSLFLIVKRSREDNSWQFPQGKVLEDENLRQACERVIDRATGKIDRWFLSNGPMAYYCYEYPPEIQKQRKQFGAKVFFLRCQYLSGNMKLETRLYKDFAWVTRDEIAEYFPEEMKDFLHAALLQ